MRPAHCSHRSCYHNVSVDLVNAGYTHRYNIYIYIYIYASCMCIYIYIYMYTITIIIIITADFTLRFTHGLKRNICITQYYNIHYIYIYILICVYRESDIYIYIYAYIRIILLSCMCANSLAVAVVAVRRLPVIVATRRFVVGRSYLSLSLYIYIYTHTYTHTYTHVYIYIYIYVCSPQVFGGISTLQSRASGLQSTEQGIPSRPKRLLRVWDGWVVVIPFFKVLQFDILAKFWNSGEMPVNVDKVPVKVWRISGGACYKHRKSTKDKHNSAFPHLRAKRSKSVALH